MTTTMEVAARPSAFVRVVMRPMTKVLNPVVRKAAGRAHFGTAALLFHTGRRTGHVYTTPVSARPGGGHFWVARTFGTGSDWCRNVVAAGECTVRWRGCNYALANPVVVERAMATHAFDGAFDRRERAMMRMIGITHFLCLDLVAGPITDAAL